MKKLPRRRQRQCFAVSPTKPRDDQKSTLASADMIEYSLQTQHTRAPGRARQRRPFCTRILWYAAPRDAGASAESKKQASYNLKEAA